MVARSRGTSTERHFALLGLLSLALLAVPLHAQEVPVTRDSVTVIPGPQFSTTSWIRWLGTPMFGARYRELWRTPLTLPLLDLTTTAGGLRATGRGTGEAAGLVFLEGADGSHWTFVPLDRTDPHSFPPNVLPVSVTDGLVADLTSGRNPAGPLVAAALAEAAGVPNTEAWLVSMPPNSGLKLSVSGDSARAGYLLRGDPVAQPDSTGPAPAGSVITSLAMLHRRLQSGNERVDGRAVLLASLFNAYVGNLDPRFLEWRWEAVAVDHGVVWRPLGIFREAALARYDGIVANLWRPLSPDLVTFGPKFPHTLTGFADQASAYRFLLGSLGRPTWDSVAAELTSRLTDSVIDAAVARMPLNYQQQVGELISRALRERRDNLPRAAAAMFEQVREQAEVHGTSAPETVVAEWLGQDSLELRIGARPFEAYAGQETKRVTVFLGGGLDTLRVVGIAGREPELRVVGTPDVPLVIVGRADEISIGPTLLPDPLAYIDSVGEERTAARRTYHPTTWLALSSGIGLLVGGGVVRTDWSGDARPYRNKITLRAAYGSDSKSGVVELLGDFRFAHSPLQLDIEAVASGVGAIYFYGFGNETPSNNSSAYYRAGRQLYGFAPTLLLPLSRRTKIGAGLALKSVTTPLDSNLYIGVARPYGSPSFGQAGFTGELLFDSRDVHGAPRRGVLASVNGAWYPWVRDGSGDFSTVTASIATYLTPRWWEAMTVALRVSGTTTSGSVPYYEAAFIGGGRTVRGLPQGRYEGNQAVFGNIDLRLRVSKIQFVVPWDFGVLGLADAGRVFVTGQPSNVWHPSIGGGLWAALLDRSLAASLNVATGAGQGVFINAAGGFTF